MSVAFGGEFSIFCTLYSRESDNDMGKNVVYYFI